MKASDVGSVGLLNEVEKRWPAARVHRDVASVIRRNKGGGLLCEGEPA